MQRFELAAGIEVSLFAAEPLLANPVCLTIDEKGVVYVGETFRHHAGVTDIRERMSWLEDDLASKTVADRLAYMRKHAGPNFDDYAGEQDRVRRIVDNDGDGVADHATVFAGGFDRHETGIGAGLLARNGDVYYTCIPDLWRLRDTDGDGVAEERAQLSTGYGTNTCLLGHDLHGLRIGPDGLLYFSSGDRGFHVETENGVLAHPAKGAVLRCRLDGSELEIYHTGLRNPQELAFDDRGNLFTGENNSDGGDQARWVEILDGADSGWRYLYQWIEEPVARGPWNDEKLWHPAHRGQAAYILPPLANLGHGPSGLTHYPGTGLSASYTDHFFLCDFRGSASHSGVYSFALTPKGASFELGPTSKLVWNCLPTDIDFTPRGGLMFTDWVGGWGKPGRGRVYHLFDPTANATREVQETARLLRMGFAERSNEELARLLEHPDQRVRQESHFTLATRATDGFELLASAALGPAPLLARLHGIWGAGIAARDHGADFMRLEMLFADPDAEIRGQMVRTAGSAGCTTATQAIVARLEDKSQRVAMLAALACGRLRSPAAIPGLLDLARRAGADPYVRHGVVFGLDGCASQDEIEASSSDPSLEVRTAALLVWRRRADPRIASFLADTDLRLEAARAIHDVPIPAAMPALADTIKDLHEDSGAPASAALVRRVINANYRLGEEAHARNLAAFARSTAAASYRAEAVERLADWNEPSGIDKVVGAWRPIEARTSPWLAGLAAQLFETCSDETADPFRIALAHLAAAAQATESAAFLSTCVLDGDASSAVRVEALLALETLAAPGLSGSVDIALAQADGELRAAALEVLDRMDPEAALPRIPRILQAGDFLERRTAYRILGRSQAPQARTLLRDELVRLEEERLPAELALDVVRAAEQHESAELAAHLTDRKGHRRKDPDMAPFLDGLFGGHVERGRRIFNRDAELSCLRCHAVTDKEAPRVGPSLAGVGKKMTRLQLLESIIHPNRSISTGYQATAFFLTDGDVVAGRILEDGSEIVRVLTSAGEVREVSLDDVESRRPDLSAMPEGLGGLMTRREMRDLLAYLGTL